MKNRPVRRVARLLFSLLFCGSLRAGAQGAATGSLFLPSLPNPAHVYVDGKPAAPRNGLLALSPGRHLLQIEARPRGDLQAFRVRIEIRAGEQRTLRVRLRSVVLPEWKSGYWSYAPPGLAGPEGEPGPAALPPRLLPDHLELLQIREVVQEGVDILIDDLQAQIDAARNRLSGCQTPLYIYAPQGLMTGPMGSSGAVGPAGRAGLAPEVGLVQTAEGKRVLDSLEQRWKWDVLRRQLGDLERRLSALVPAPGAIAVTPPTLQVLTPEWKAGLDRSLQARRNVPPPTGIVELADIQGPVGARGRRGPDGSPAPQARPIRLSRQDFETLADAVSDTGDDRSRFGHLWATLADLEQRVACAEADRTEAPPKPAR